MATETWRQNHASLVLIGYSDNTAEVVLNRPTKSNAFNSTLWEEFPKAFLELSRREDVRSVIIRGEGRNFCAGIDLEYFGQTDFANKKDDDRCPARLRYAAREHILKMQDAYTVLEKLPCPVIACIHGACVGAGVDLITACDIRYASEDAFFSVKEVDVGITADLGTLQRLPGIVGHGVARELALTARRITAAEAKRINLITECYPDVTSMLDTARKVASQLAAKSPLAIAGTKRVLLYQRDHTIQDGLDYIATWNSGMLVGSEDLAKAVSASLTRKPARFSKL